MLIAKRPYNRSHIPTVRSENTPHGYMDPEHGALVCRVRVQVIYQVLVGLGFKD